MSQPLARLRLNLDFMPSPVPDQPGLFIRDPYRFSDAMLIVPPVLVECLECFDGSHTELDLRAMLVRATGDLEVSAIALRLAETLSQAGFLEDETFERMRSERMRQFAEQPVRAASHAGSAYPADGGGLAPDDGALHGRRSRRAGGRRGVRHCGAARQPGGRMAIVSRGLCDAAGPSTASARS